MSKKLAAKAGLIQMPPAPVESKPSAAGAPLIALGPNGALGPREGSEPRPKTAPGSMLNFMTTQSAAVQEAEHLRGRLQQFDGASPGRLLDPKTIRLSTWANRHDANFEGAEFAELKAEIASAGKNVQPIKVRPLASAAPAGEQYELVFGQRRLRACLELGLPVFALIEKLTDQQLFGEMERENRNRKDLSAWEQGQMYARALDKGLYASNRQLANAIGRDLGDIGKALSLARLPKSVIESFESPLDLQYRWAKPLSDAQQRDPEGLLVRTRELKKRSGVFTAKQIFEYLTGRAVPPAAPPPVAVDLRKGAKAVGRLTVDAEGRVTILLEAGLVAEDRRQALADAIEGFLAN